MKIIISEQAKMLFNTIKNSKVINGINHTKIQELITRTIHNDSKKYQENTSDSFHDLITASPSWRKILQAYQQMAQTGKDADMVALLASSFIADMLKPNMMQHECDRIIDKALDAVKPLISGTLGEDTPGMDSRNISDRLASASLFSEGKAREIIDALGKMWGDFQDSRYATDSVNTVESPTLEYTLEYGNEINRLVADEYLKDQQLFYLEYAEERLLQYGTKPDTRKAMGPIVILLEESEAMQLFLDSGEQKYVWGKSFALMVAKIAKEQGRPVKLVGFSSTLSGRSSPIDYVLDINNCTPQELTGVVNFLPNEEGTNWVGTFANVVKMFEGEYEAADILFVTSGDYSITTKKFNLEGNYDENIRFVDCFADWKGKKNIRVTGVLIANEITECKFVWQRGYRIADANKYCIDNVKAIADDVVCINDIADTSKLFGRLSSL